MSCDSFIHSPKRIEVVAESSISTVSLHSLHPPKPECFSGEAGNCHSFISQCALHFELNASVFSSDRAKITFRISN